MRAVTVVDEKVEIRDHPDPVPGKGEVLVRVHAAGMNAADLIQVRGGYPPPPGWPADILGIELAGEVIDAGPGATRFGTGERVMAIVGGGGQAELAVIHEREVMPVPAILDWESAGGLPEAFMTAHDALFSQAGLSLGEHLLVSGAAGGVGTAAVQLGAAAGARVTASVRDPARRPGVAALGAEVVDPADIAAHGPFDVVLELVGTANMETNLVCLATGGRVCVIGGQIGPTSTVNLGLLMGSRGRIHGSTLRYRPLEAKAAVARLVETHVLPLVESGRIKVPIDSAFSLEDAPAAYERFAAGHKLGKVVLTCS